MSENEYTPDRQQEPMGAVSLVCAILAWVLNCACGLFVPCVGIIGLGIALIGALCGVLSIRKIKDEPEMWKSNTMAIVGLVLSLINLFLVALSMFLVLGLGIGSAFIENAGNW